MTFLPKMYDLYPSKGLSNTHHRSFYNGKYIFKNIKKMKKKLKNCFNLFVSLVLGMESRTSHMVGKCSITSSPPPALKNYFIILIFIYLFLFFAALRIEPGILSLRCISSPFNFFILQQGLTKLPRLA